MKLSFLVPNEEPTAKVTEVQIVFPTPPQTPIPTVTVEQKPGWTVKVTTQKLAKPITTDDGSITDVVSLIDWKAKTAGRRDRARAVRRVHDRRRRPPRRREPSRVQGDPDLLERHRRALDRSRSRRAVPRPSTRRRSSSSRTPTGDSDRDDHADDHRAGRRTARRSSRRRRRTTARVRSAIVAIVLGAIALILATGALMKKRRA